MSRRPTVLMRLPAANGYVQSAVIPDAIRSIVVLNNLAATIGLRFGFDVPTAASYDFEVAANGMAILPVLDVTFNAVVVYPGAVPASDVPLTAMVLGSPVVWSPLAGAGVIQGLGTAGSPLGGVMTVQGGVGGALPLGALGVSGDNNPLYPIAMPRTESGTFTGPVVMVPVLNAGGARWEQRTPSSPHSIASVAVTAGTPQSIWTPAVGKKFRLMVYDVSLSVAGSIIFKDGPAGGPYVEIWRTPKLVAGTPHPAPPGFGNGILSAAVNNQLWIDVTATGTVDGVFGTEE